MSRRKVKTILIVAFLSLALTACNVPLTVEPASANVEWFLGIDITDSIKQEQFKSYHLIALESVLSRLRPRDRVHVLIIDSDPREGVRTFSLDKGKAGVAAKAAEIYEYIKSFKQPIGYRGTTNLAGALSYVKEVANRARQDEVDLQNKGKATPVGPHYVAMLLTDGRPDGKQMILDGEWPANVPVWAVGVDQKYSGVFKTLCQKQMNIPNGQVHIVSFATWESGIRTFGLDIDRPQNRALREELVTGVKSAAGL